MVFEVDVSDGQPRRITCLSHFLIQDIEMSMCCVSFSVNAVEPL